MTKQKQLRTLPDIFSLFTTDHFKRTHKLWSPAAVVAEQGKMKLQHSPNLVS